MVRGWRLLIGVGCLDIGARSAQVGLATLELRVWGFEATIAVRTRRAVCL